MLEKFIIVGNKVPCNSVLIGGERGGREKEGEGKKRGREKGGKGERREERKKGEEERGAG